MLDRSSEEVVVMNLPSLMKAASPPIYKLTKAAPRATTLTPAALIWVDLEPAALTEMDEGECLLSLQ